MSKAAIKTEASPALEVDDIVRVYTTPFSGQRARVAYLFADGSGLLATVVFLEPVTSRKRTLWAAGESARVPAGKCRKVDGPSPAGGS